MPCNDVMDCTSISDLSAIDYIDTRDLKKLRRELQGAVSILSSVATLALTPKGRRSVLWEDFLF
jgi:hypothetical protein